MRIVRSRRPFQKRHCSSPTTTNDASVRSFDVILVRDVSAADGLGREEVAREPGGKKQKPEPDTRASIRVHDGCCSLRAH